MAAHTMLIPKYYTLEPQVARGTKARKGMPRCIAKWFFAMQESIAFIISVRDLIKKSFFLSEHLATRILFVPWSSVYLWCCHQHYGLPTQQPLWGKRCGKAFPWGLTMLVMRTDVEGEELHWVSAESQEKKMRKILVCFLVQFLWVYYVHDL